MEWLSELEEGDSVFVCALTQQNQKLRLKGRVAQTIEGRIEVTAWLDKPTPLSFDRLSGKEIEGHLWIEQDDSDE